MKTGFSNSDDVLPIYIGDDRTDEDAFKVKFNQINIFLSPCRILFVNVRLNLMTLHSCYLLGFEGRKPWIWDFGVFRTQRKQSFLVSPGHF